MGEGDVPATLRGVEAELAGSALARPAWLRAHIKPVPFSTPLQCGAEPPQGPWCPGQRPQAAAAPNPSWGSGPPSGGRGDHVCPSRCERVPCALPRGSSSSWEQVVHGGMAPPRHVVLGVSGPPSALVFHLLGRQCPGRGQPLPTSLCQSGEPRCLLCTAPARGVLGIVTGSPSPSGHSRYSRRDRRPPTQTACCAHGRRLLGNAPIQHAALAAGHRTRRGRHLLMYHTITQPGRTWRSSRLCDVVRIGSGFDNIDIKWPGT